MRAFLIFLILVIPSHIFALGRGGPVVCAVPDDPNQPPVLATEHFYDGDGDGVPEWGSRAWICPGDDFGKTYISIETTDSGLFPESSYDCDPGNKNYWMLMTVYGPDADGDGFPSVVEEPHLVCSGPSGKFLMGYDTHGQAMNGVIDCNDNDMTVAYLKVYPDSDGDGAIDGYGALCTPELIKDKSYVSEYVPTLIDGRVGLEYRDPLPPDDCAIDNPSIQGGVAVYLDSDHDGYGTGKPTYLCGNILDGLMSEADIPDGYSKNNKDCNDTNPEVNVSCKMNWALEPYYDNGAKPKYVVAHPANNNTYGRDLQINLADYLKYDGDDKDQVVYTVDCSFCKKEEVSGGFYHGEVVIEDKKVFGGKAGPKTVTVHAKSTRSGLSASGTISVYVVTGEAIVYINGINTGLSEFTDLDASACSDGALVNGRCDHGAFGGMARLKQRTEPLLLEKYSPVQGYTDFSLAYNRTEGKLEDVILQCLPSSVVDRWDAAEAKQFRRDYILFSKFGKANDLATHFPDFLPKFMNKSKDFLIEAIRTYNVNQQDYETALRLVESKIRSGNRVTIVSHSQGNFISNQVYRDLDPKLRELFVRQVQVAAPTLRSEDDKDRYVNAVGDPVAAISWPVRSKTIEPDCIDHMFSYDLNIFPPVNISFDMKHNFIKCYIGGEGDGEDRKTWVEMKGLIDAALDDTKFKFEN